MQNTKGRLYVVGVGPGHHDGLLVDGLVRLEDHARLIGSGLGRRGKVSTSLLGPRGALDPVDPDRYTLAPARPEESVDRIAVSSQGFAWNGCSASRGLIPAFGRPDSILKSWRGRDSFLTYRIDSGVGDGQGG